MVKPFLAIKLKDPQHYYLDNETIDCLVDLRLEKVLQDAVLRVTFTGRSSSFSNGARNHAETIFTRHREISISEWNTAANLKKMSQIEFVMEIPSDIKIPSYKNLEGSDGGKIEYMIEANLEAVGGMFKRKNTVATHIIQIPLIGNTDVSKNGLHNPRESSIRWPKNEDNANTCVFSAWIPHEGCVRGKDIPIRVELKQPDRYQPPKTILVELVRQELIASNKDRLPEMTKQITDKIIHKDEKSIKMHPDIGGNRLLSLSRILVVSTPSNITPTIRENAKVMRLDYKIRISVLISGADSGRDKVLNVNLPIVVGTTGGSEMSDSGFELSLKHQFAQESRGGGSEGTNSVHNGYEQQAPFYPLGDTSSFGINQPPLLGGGFHVPDPHYGYPSLNNMYPPPTNRFVINPQQLKFNSTDPNDGSNKIEGMPMPDFGNSAPYPPIDILRDNNNDDLISSLSSSPSNATVSSPNTDRISQIQMYPPYVNNSNNKSDFGYLPPSSIVMMPIPRSSNSINSPFAYGNSTQQQSLAPEGPTNKERHDNDDSNSTPQLSQSPPDYTTDLKDNNNVASLGPSFDDLYITPTVTVNPVEEKSPQQDRMNSVKLSFDKPNTPTPPQTPASSQAKNRPLVKPSDSSTSSYHSTLLANDSNIESDESATTTPTQNKSMLLRIDPLDRLAESINNTN